MGATWFRRGREALGCTSRVHFTASKRSGKPKKPTITLSSLSQPEEGLEAHRPQVRLYEGIPMNPVRLVDTMPLLA